MAGKARSRSKIDYIAAMKDIRAIVEGCNAERRTMIWREAVEVWEQMHGRDEVGRARFFVRIGIATTDECKLLDGMEV